MSQQVLEILNGPPRPPNSIKINVDAAYDAHLMKGAIAAVARDETSVFLTGFARTLVCSSSIAAEAIAVREAFSLAGAFNGYDVTIESDCAEVVRGCNEENSP